MSILGRLLRLLVLNWPLASCRNAPGVSLACNLVRLAGIPAGLVANTDPLLQPRERYHLLLGQKGVVYAQRFALRQKSCKASLSRASSSMHSPS
jgi:hypothetical protein